jgi:UDP-N-acetylmuramoylalanine--D-glutamate ligase
MRVAIAGYGIEGEASYRYYVARGDEVTILDETQPVSRSVPEGAQVRLGPDAFDRLDAYDIVVRTPALRPDALRGAKKIWSATNEFFAQCPAPIIGVTGTKGKGTTCSLIASILRAAGRTVHLVGNIGTPALDVLPNVRKDDIVVYELSSFQLWDITQSPHIAVVLMIEPDHLDVHASFEEYVGVKSRIAAYQDKTDVMIWNPRNEYASSIGRSSCGIAAPYLVDSGAYARDGRFWFGPEQLCSVDVLRLPGKHNIENACAAIAACWYALDGDTAVVREAVEAGLGAFTGLPHRLKFVREVAGVRYYDDSIATTAGSAIAALRSFDGPKVIILGGSDKGTSYQDVIDECVRASVRVVAIGQTGVQIAELCGRVGVSFARETGSMKEVVARASHEAHPGDVVILSPASASFDQYKSYGDRGDQFIAAVKEL